MNLSLNPAAVVWGSNSTCTITLDALTPRAATVTLTSSDPVGTWTSVPTSVQVAAGARSASFEVGTSQVYVPEQVTITANYNGLTSTVTLTVILPTVASVSCSPAAVFAGDTTVCTVTLTGPAPADTLVRISSSDVVLAPVPPSLTVPAGASSATFSINTAFVAAPTTVTLSANAAYTVPASTTLTINLTNRGRTWALNNVTFSDGGTANGYFTYDETTGNYLDVNIATGPGANAQGPWGKSPESPYRFPQHDWITADPANQGSGSSQLIVVNLVFDETSPTTQEDSVLILTFAQPLTDAGGTIALAVNPNAPFTPECTYPVTCIVPPATISYERFDIPYSTPPAHWFRIVIGGSVTTAQ